MPGLRERHAPDFVVANGENAAGGVGITERTARELFDAGVDAITLGNHAYRHAEVYGYLDREERIVRPANYPKGSPGRGITVVERDGMALGVVNLSGTLFLEAARSPFAEADSALAELRGKATHVLVDMHAEATSEKVAMGWHLDGRVTACVGTHTHVPTADARVLPGGTAYCTDVGMTGARGGVIGVKKELALERFQRMTAVRFESSDEDPWLNAVLVEAGEDGLATSIEQILEQRLTSARARAQRQRRHRAAALRRPTTRQPHSGRRPRRVVVAGRELVRASAACAADERGAQRVHPPRERQRRRAGRPRSGTAGERTFPNAANAATAASEASTSVARVRRPAQRHRARERGHGRAASSAGEEGQRPARC